MFCPVCGSEFVEGIDTCPDDQVALVDVLAPLPLSPVEHAPVALTPPHHPSAQPPADLPEDGDLITVYDAPEGTPPGAPDAEFIWAALDENDIKAYIAEDEPAAAPEPLLSGAPENGAGAEDEEELVVAHPPVQILVERTDLLRAQEVLADMELEEAPIATSYAIVDPSEPVLDPEGPGLTQEAFADPDTIPEFGGQVALGEGQPG